MYSSIKGTVERKHGFVFCFLANWKLRFLEMIRNIFVSEAVDCD